MLKAKLEAWKAQKKGTSGKPSSGPAVAAAAKRPHAYVPPPLFSSSSTSSVSTPGTIQRIKTMRQEQIGPFSSASYAASCVSSSSSSNNSGGGSSSGSSSSGGGGKGKQASRVGGESNQQENYDPNRLPNEFVALSLRFDGPPTPERENEVEEGKEREKEGAGKEGECASCARLRKDAADGSQECLRLHALCSGLEQQAREVDGLRRQLDEAAACAAKQADRVAAQEAAMQELSARRAAEKACNEAVVAELRAVCAVNEALLQQVDGFTVQVNELSDLRRGEKAAMRARDAELEARAERAEQGEQAACIALARETARTAMALEDAHATAFLNAVQEQRINELQRRDRREQEEGLAAQLERVRLQHVAEVRRLQRDKNDYEASANECIQTMTQQMAMIQTMTLRKIEALERELGEWKDGTRTP